MRRFHEIDKKNEVEFSTLDHCQNKCKAEQGLGPMQG